MSFNFSKRRTVGRSKLAAAHSSALDRLTVFVLRRRRLVLAAWAAVLAAGLVAAVLLPARLSTSFAVPDTDSERAARALAAGFGERPEGSFAVVFRVADPEDALLRARLERRLARAAEVLPGGHVAFVRAGGGVVYGELATTLTLQQARGRTESLRRALAGADPPPLVSGPAAIQHDLDPILASDLRRGEAVALPIALLALLTVLGLSLALAVPFLFAACTVAGTLAAVYGAALLFPITTYATNLVVLLGFGLAIDYSLLVVLRYREELAHVGAGRRAREVAIVRTMTSAGRAVVISGLAVSIGLALLLFVPVPFIRTMGIVGLLIPLISIMAALTLQPALLSLLGGSARVRSGRRAPWAALARTVMHRPLLILLPTTALLLVAAAPALLIKVGPGSLAGLPPQTESAEGLRALRNGVGAGALTPTQVIVDAGAPGLARRVEVRTAIDRLGDRLFTDPEVHLVASGSDAPYVDASGRYARVVVVGRHEYGEPVSRRLVERLRARHVPAAGFPSGVRVVAGGAPAQGVDFLDRAYAIFPWLVLAALSLTYLVLAKAFRSLLLPLQAVLLNLLSVAASYGLLVLVFQHGFAADLLSVQRATQIEGWIPIFLFATLFGLSMDYEVFMVSRMRETWDATHDNVSAVAAGLERTGPLISVAAVVMIGAFAGFVLGSVPGLQQFGLGLALAVLIDATLVRLLLVPSLMAVFGRWNWWLPPSFERRLEGVSDARAAAPPCRRAAVEEAR